MPAAPVWPLVVVGAGAAGLSAAIFAARAGARVLLFETRPRPGAKIRVSGGGRCNVLPSRVEPGDFHTQGSAHALRNVLASWPLSEVRVFFERELGIALKVEPTGKVVPVSEDPREVVAALLSLAERSGATLVAGQRIVALERLPSPAGDGARFELESEGGERQRARCVLLATGGLSLPKTGSDGAGLAMAARLGHRPRPDYPALVPLLAADLRWTQLAGLSSRARLRVHSGGRAVEEREGDLLFTHRGFSGPVVLDLSWRLASGLDPQATLSARWLGRNTPEWDPWLRQGGRAAVGAALRAELPRRLCALLLELSGVDPERRLSELSRQERRALLEALDTCPLGVSGNEGYRTAEVTGGGIPLEELHTRTLESRLVPGLYLAGEMIDVTGRIGGYNFLWAWVSGRHAGLAAARALDAAAPGAEFGAPAPM